MERPEHPTLDYLKQIGCLLVVLNGAAAIYAALIGGIAAGWHGAVVLFAWGSALVSSGIAGVLCLNLLYAGARALFARVRRPHR